MTLGQTEITYLGHATLLMKTPVGRQILIDPFLTHNPSCPEEWGCDSKLSRVVRSSNNVCKVGVLFATPCGSEFEHGFRASMFPSHSRSL
ncbi:MAG: MBL fold metallo-hydrolase, partial [Armatimonadetes bacterium]|nr:MBL fold metallo-hydrolase [Armatimonadota bacterium]